MGKSRRFLKQGVKIYPLYKYPGRSSFIFPCPIVVSGTGSMGTFFRNTLCPADKRTSFDLPSAFIWDEESPYDPPPLQV